MGAPARQPSQDEQVRRLQELVRRLYTRLPQAAGDAVEPWQSLAPYVGAGWAVDGTITDALHARFYQDRDRVYFMGVLYYGGGGNSDVPIASMPAGYRPTWLQNSPVFTDPDNTQSSGPDTRNESWMAECLPSNGSVVLDQNKNFLTTYSGFPPPGTYLVLDTLSYRLS